MFVLLVVVRGYSLSRLSDENKREKKGRRCMCTESTRLERLSTRPKLPLVMTASIMMPQTPLDNNDIIIMVPLSDPVVPICLSQPFCQYLRGLLLAWNPLMSDFLRFRCHLANHMIVIPDVFCPVMIGQARPRSSWLHDYEFAR